MSTRVKSRHHVFQVWDFVVHLVAPFQRTVDVIPLRDAAA